MEFAIRPDIRHIHLSFCASTVVFSILGLHGLMRRFALYACFRANACVSGVQRASGCFLWRNSLSIVFFPRVRSIFVEVLRFGMGAKKFCFRRQSSSSKASANFVLVAILRLFLFGLGCVGSGAFGCYLSLVSLLSLRRLLWCLGCSLGLLCHPCVLGHFCYLGHLDSG